MIGMAVIKGKEWQFASSGFEAVTRRGRARFSGPCYLHEGKGELAARVIELSLLVDRMYLIKNNDGEIDKSRLETAHRGAERDAAELRWMHAAR